MRLKGKVAAWFYGVMLFVAAVEVPLAAVCLWVDPDAVGAAVCLGSLVAIEGLCLWILLRNDVKFQEERLLVAFGPFRKTVRYADIVGASPCKNAWSGLAASLDRVKITTKQGGDILLAVADKKRFFDEIRRRCPNAAVVGGATPAEADCHQQSNG